MLQKPQGAEEKKLLDTLLLSANNLLFIINDILDFSKIESGKINMRFVPVNFEQMARQLVDEAHDWLGDKPVQLLLHIDEGVNQFVQSDPERMRQVLLNLLSNAVKFTLRGKVELQIKKQFETEDSLTLEFSVTDTGIGIPEEKQQIIFDKFTQVDTSIKRGYGGTGLGLAICREILALQQIQLHLESTEGVGSRFWFVHTFQKHKQNDRGIAYDEQQFSAASFADFFAGKTVLVAEDNTINMMVVEKVLTNQAPAIKLLKAFNGKSAVTLFKAHQPDLVLMDVQMPLVNGLDACRQIREYEQKHGLPRTAILALTATTHDEEHQQCMEAGMDGVLSKPFKQEDLRNQMMRLLWPK
jgi:CheY-like chemotaxis protein